MKKRYKNVFDKSRRDLFKIIGSAGISQGLLRASPLVMGTMISRLADAQQTRPNKSVIIYIPDGCIPQQFFPNSNLTAWKPMSQPYQTVASECNFLKNMGHHRAGHGVIPTIINNSWGGDSFDVNMGRILSQNHPFAYVNLGVHSNGKGCLTKDNGHEVPFEDNPFNAFDRLFGNASGGGGTRSPRLNIIDAHLDAVNALKLKLGSHERQRLESHLSAIEDMQKRLNGGSSTCNVGSPPDKFALGFEKFREQAHLQSDIIALALRCNLTASCSIAFGNEAAEFSFPYLNYKDVYHQSIHGGNNGDSSYPHFRETRAHLSGLSAYLINKLKNVGVLDSTIVCEVTDMGNGDAHSSNDIPLIMAGGGGAIHRKVSNAGGSSYTPLNQIHTAAVVLNAHQHSAYQKYATEVIPGVLR